MSRQEDLLSLEIELLRAAGRRYGMLLERTRQDRRERARKGAALPFPLFAKIGKHRTGRSRTPKKITAEQ